MASNAARSPRWAAASVKGSISRSLSPTVPPAVAAALGRQTGRLLRSIVAAHAISADSSARLSLRCAAAARESDGDYFTHTFHMSMAPIGSTAWPCTRAFATRKQRQKYSGMTGASDRICRSAWA